MTGNREQGAGGSCRWGSEGRVAEHLAEGDGVDEHVGGILRRGPACLQGGVPGMSDGHRSLWLRTVPACGHHDLSRSCRATGASSGVLRGRNSEVFNS